MSEEKRLLLSKFTSGYFVSSVKENEKWNNIEQQYRISEEIYEDIEQLQQENQELKKQLHEASIEIQSLIEENMSCPSSCSKIEELKELLEASRRVSKHHLNRELDLENQQKEFIEWLEDGIRTLEMLEETFILINYKNEIRIYKEILSKYKEIIGGSNDQ